jgi:hypothetical protein
METISKFEMLRDTPVAGMVAEESTKELDDILDEVANLAETMGVEETASDNMVADREQPVDESDFGMKTGDYLELDIDVPMETTDLHAKTTSLAEETESALNALIDVENEVSAALAKEVGANDSQDSSSTVTGKDKGYKDTEKGSAGYSNTREESVCDAPAEDTVSNEICDNLPAYNEKSSEDLLGVQESESEVECVSASVGEISTPQGSNDQLADVLGNKIEATLSRLFEERLSVLVEGAIMEKLDTIFSSVG